MSELAVRITDAGKVHRRLEGMANAAACGYIWWYWQSVTTMAADQAPPEDMCKSCWPGRAR